MFSAHRSHLLLWIVFVIILYCASFHTIVDARGGKGKGKKSKKNKSEDASLSQDPPAEDGTVTSKAKSGKGKKKSWGPNSKKTKTHSDRFESNEYLMTRSNEQLLAKATHHELKADDKHVFLMEVQVADGDVRYCPSTTSQKVGEKHTGLGTVTIDGVKIWVLKCEGGKFTLMPNIFFSNVEGRGFCEVVIEKKAYKGYEKSVKNGAVTRRKFEGPIGGESSVPKDESELPPPPPDRTEDEGDFPPPPPDYADKPEDEEGIPPPPPDNADKPHE